MSELLYQTILFDLDGTVTDPKKGITNSVAYALNKFGVSVASKDELVKFIGPPLRDSFKEFYGFSDEEAETAVTYYREYFTEKGLFENTLYDGMTELLRTLKEQGCQLAIATSKPTVYAKRIIDHFELDGYFDVIVGSELDGTRSDKAEIVRYAMSRLSVRSLDSVIMIGDRKHDIIGANKNNIQSAGVVYGYGSDKELKDAGATHVVKTIDELMNVLVDIRKDMTAVEVVDLQLKYYN